MKTKLVLPNGSSKMGAQMGRRSYLHDVYAKKLKLRMERLPFVDQCYDIWGAYWGSPANVYCAWDEDGTQLFVRGDTRSEAKEKIRGWYPDKEIKFFR